MLLVFAR